MWHCFFLDFNLITYRNHTFINGATVLVSNTYVIQRKSQMLAHLQPFCKELLKCLQQLLRFFVFNIMSITIRIQSMEHSQNSSNHFGKCFLQPTNVDEKQALSYLHERSCSLQVHFQLLSTGPIIFQEDHEIY